MIEKLGFSSGFFFPGIYLRDKYDIIKQTERLLTKKIFGRE